MKNSQVISKVFIGLITIFLIYSTFIGFIGWNNRCVAYDGFSPCLFQEDFNISLLCAVGSICMIGYFLFVMKNKRYIKNFNTVNFLGLIMWVLVWIIKFIAYTTCVARGDIKCGLAGALWVLTGLILASIFLIIGFILFIISKIKVK